MDSSIPVWLETGMIPYSIVAQAPWLVAQALPVCGSVPDLPVWPSWHRHFLTRHRACLCGFPPPVLR
ncbi:hypothetical protein SBA4_7210005 [Candidatus Sulfopaludibacter sp. SbA4]|nr:hypothetical protein SBA4_7210005 [Candidatus Sulfopaludibacter sp. SbA4]